MCLALLLRVEAHDDNDDQWLLIINGHKGALETLSMEDEGCYKSKCWINELPVS